MKVLIAFLIVFVLIGVMFIPVVEVCVEVETDKIVGALSDESVGFAAAWATALRMTSKIWGSDVAEKLLSKESIRCESIDFRVIIYSTHNRNGAILLDNGTILMFTKMETVAQMKLAFIFYDSLNKIHKAFKERSEREFG